jgi:hypothetical protein
MLHQRYLSKGFRNVSSALLLKVTLPTSGNKASLEQLQIITNRVLNQGVN